MQSIQGGERPVTGTYGVVDFRGTQPITKGGLGQLYSFASQLIGEPILFGAISYPSELTIHFGKPVEFQGPKKTVLTEGTYVLNTVSSAWRIKSAQQGRTVLRYPDIVESWFPYPAATISDDEVDSFLEKIGGAFVRDIDIAQLRHGFGLRLALTDGSTIEVVPMPDHFEINVNDPIPIPPPDWELFTPYERYLNVGPGTQWSYLPSDKSEKTE